MSGAAEIRLTDRPGVFLADTCTVENGVIHAHGRWRYRVGANHVELRYSGAGAYSWPVRRCAEVRWAVVA